MTIYTPSPFYWQNVLPFLWINNKIFVMTHKVHVTTWNIACAKCTYIFKDRNKSEDYGFKIKCFFGCVICSLFAIFNSDVTVRLIFSFMIHVVVELQYKHGRVLKTPGNEWGFKTQFVQYYVNDLYTKNIMEKMVQSPREQSYNFEKLSFTSTSFT